MKIVLNVKLLCLVLLYSTSLFGQYNIGDKVEPFSLKSTTGEMVSLSDYEGAVVVVFTCNTCPYAVNYEDRLIEFHNTYAAKGFPILAINPNDPEVKPGDSFEAMQIRAKEKSFPFPYVFDEGQKVYPQFGAKKTPHVYVLDDEKKVRYIGAIDDNAQSAEGVKEKYLANAIEALMAGNSPEPSETKAIGCTIKTK